MFSSLHLFNHWIAQAEFSRPNKVATWAPFVIMACRQRKVFGHAQKQSEQNKMT